MKKIIFALLFIPLILQAQFERATSTSHQTAKDTVLISSGQTILHSIVIDRVGTADTLAIWDGSGADSTSVANATVKFLIQVSGFSRVAYFGPQGIYFKNGLILAIRGTTSGIYTFVYE